MTPMAGKIEVILYSVTVAVATEGATVPRRTVPIRHLADQSYTNLSTYNTLSIIVSLALSVLMTMLT